MTLYDAVAGWRPGSPPFAFFSRIVPCPLRGEVVHETAKKERLDVLPHRSAV